MSKWIEFVKVEPRPAKMMTDIYYIRTKDGNTMLGQIRWYAPWRKYSFFPYESTVFETQCLCDIVAFINKLMEDRKK